MLRSLKLVLERPVQEAHRQVSFVCGKVSGTEHLGVKSTGSDARFGQVMPRGAVLSRICCFMSAAGDGCICDLCARAYSHE